MFYVVALVVVALGVLIFASPIKNAIGKLWSKIKSKTGV